MAGTPSFKVHDDTGRYVAATVDASLAAALIGAAGAVGWKIKHDGRIVWREGSEPTTSFESIDAVAEIINDRITARWLASDQETLPPGVVRVR